MDADPPTGLSPALPADLPVLAATFELGRRERGFVEGLMAGTASPVWLVDLDDQARATALRAAATVLARDTGKELRPHEPALLSDVKLIQFLTAGVDFVPLSQLPAHVPIANNGGAYADSMAEHALAMTLAAAKRLLIEHNALIAGEFNQFTRNRVDSKLSWPV